MLVEEKGFWRMLGCPECRGPERPHRALEKERRSAVLVLFLPSFLLWNYLFLFLP